MLLVRKLRHRWATSEQGHSLSLGNGSHESTHFIPLPVLPLMGTVVLGIFRKFKEKGA